METDAYDTLIHQIYAGILAPAEWDMALAGTCDALGFSQGCVLLSGAARGGTSVVQSFNTDPDFIRAYEETYCRIDPGKSFVSRLRAGEWYVDAMHLHPGYKSHSEFYQDFMRPQGFTSNICAALHRSQFLMAGLSFQSPESLPDLDQSLSRRARSSLISHFSRAAVLRFKLDELTRAALKSQALIERINSPVMIVNQSADVLYANALAETWLHAAIGSPAASGARVSRKGSIHHTVAQLFERGYAVTTLLDACDEDGRQPLLVGLPLTMAHPIAQMEDEPLGILVVHIRGSGNATAASLLARIYGLSRAEHRLLLTWADHMSLPAASLALHVSVETVRTQIKSVFAKTGCEGQSELARLVGQLGVLA